MVAHSTDDKEKQQPQDAPLLSIRSVSKFFGALAAVDSLSCELSRGEVLGIGGPNGAGKTTLFDVISGLSPASRGQVLFEGHDITRDSPESICHRGMARTFQLNAGFDTLTAQENVEVSLIYGHTSPIFPGFSIGSEVREKSASVLEMVGLIDHRNALTAELSVLDRKLLMVATAIVTQPRLLLLDEPVGGLTTTEMDAFQKVVHRIKRTGVTIVLIEHVMRFLVSLSDRVLIMHHGQKIYEGSPEELVSDERVVDVYLGKGASERLKPVIAGYSARNGH